MVRPYLGRIFVSTEVLLLFIIKQLKEINKDMGLKLLYPPNKQFLLDVCNTLFPWCPLISTDLKIKYEIKLKLA